MGLFTTTGTSDFSQCLAKFLEFYSLNSGYRFRALGDLLGLLYLPPYEPDRHN